MGNIEIYNAPSRSQKKRMVEELQMLGKQLVQQKKIPTNAGLPEDLISAINSAKLMKSNGALRRQILFIGKLMRQWDEDSPEDVAALKVIYMQESQQKQRDKKITAAANKWVVDIVSDGLSNREKTLNNFTGVYPEVTENQIEEIQALIAQAQVNRKKIKFVKNRLLILIKKIIYE